MSRDFVGDDFRLCRTYAYIHRGTIGVIKATTTQIGIRLAFTVNFHTASSTMEVSRSSTEKEARLVYFSTSSNDF
jgi:hypothetical protein